MLVVLLVVEEGVPDEKFFTFLFFIMECRIELSYSSVYDRQLALLANQVKDNSYFEARKKLCLHFIKEFDQLETLNKFLIFASNLLKIDWTDKIIIYILPNFHGAIVPIGFSNPCTVALEICKKEEFFKLNKNQFLVLIIHELAHIVQKKVDLDFSNFELKNRLIQNHILTYALLKKFLPVNLFELEIQKSQKNINYSKAMQIVLDEGVNKIFEKVIT